MAHTRIWKIPHGAGWIFEVECRQCGWLSPTVLSMDAAATVDCPVCAEHRRGLDRAKRLWRMPERQIVRAT